MPDINRATDLTVAKSADAAETVAATLADLASTQVIDSALAGSANRLVRKLAKELCELHNLDHDVVLRRPRPGSNGTAPNEVAQSLTATSAIG